jgi:putative methyltransferase (TIGR04325 family)
MNANGKRLLERLKSLPPVLAWRRRRYDRRFVELRAGHLFRGLFSSFEAAQASAPPGRATSYDNPEAAAMYRDRLSVVYPSDYPVLFWLQRLLWQGVTSLFEIGGHIGVGYYAYQRFLDYPAALRWTVMDLPAVVEQGRRHALANDVRRQLAFTSEVKDADGADLLFASGSLQYLPQTLDDMLPKLDAMPRWLLLSMVPIHPSQQYYTLQNIVTAYCAYRIDSRERFVKALAELGYSLRDEWQNAEKACHIAYEPAHSLDHYKGFLFERSGA